MEVYDQRSILDKVFDEYCRIVEKYYPDIVSDGMGYSGPQFHYRFSVRYKDYKRTPFFYNSERKFVHWTTLTNLFSIVNNNELRLYSLENSEDQEEFTYAAKLLALSERQLKILKENYYAASFCSLDNLENDFLWESYGKNYSGVAIAFSFVDNTDDWKNFFLSNVYYELDPTLEIFCNEIEELKKKYNNSPIFMTDIWRFAGFYKKNQFQNENEVRLACILPFDSQIDYLRYVRRELKMERDRNRIVNYIPFKLWIDPQSSHFKTLEIGKINHNSFELVKPELPKIKIDAVYFGENCGLTKQEYWSFHNQLKEIFEWRLGYSIELPLNLYP